MRTAAGLGEVGEVPARGGEQHPGEAGTPQQHREAALLAEADGLLGVRGSLVPCPGEEVVHGEHEECSHRLRLGVIEAAGFDEPLERPARQVTDVPPCLSDLDHAQRARRLVEGLDHPVQLPQHLRGGPDRVSVRRGRHPHRCRQDVAEACDDRVERGPELRPAAEGAHRHQGQHGILDGPDVGLSVRRRDGCLVQGAHEDPVGGVDVSLVVEQAGGRGDRDLQGPCGVGVFCAGAVQERRRAAQRAGDVGTDEHRLREPSSPLRRCRAQLGGTQQQGAGAHAVTAVQGPGGEILQEAGHGLVGRQGAVGAVERPDVVVLGQLGQAPVRGPPLVGRGQVDDGGADQRMGEDNPVPAAVNRDEAAGLGGLEVGLGGGDHSHQGRPGPVVQGSEQEQPPGRCR
ncbi:hypothetical protein RKE38_02250 [Phycicoccus sp. M110.8]|uniref:hypothetical protein n=1 Tax=Phycicoccus sp. M110.8 TaxID=3075433 RepID=UPI0028FD5C68|nr:hypothetical protein [Phycicoccus sp. M110.8]MDU0312490.1 hypothetical protein [Phycicoccus sp. M110.8]